MKNMVENIEKRIRNFGYEKYHINLFEEYEYYYQNRAFIDDDSLVKVIHGSGSLYALQADVTLSAAKVYANKKIESTATQKIYYYGQTYSSIIAPNSGIKSRTVLGIEWFGVSDIYSDIEVIQLAYSSLKSVGRTFILEISESEVLDRLLFELTQNEKKIVKDFIWSKNFDELRHFLGSCNISEEAQKTLLAFCQIKGTLKEACIQLGKLDGNEEIKRCLIYFQRLQEYAIACDIGEALYVDFTLKNKRNYYKGIIFSGFIEGIHQPVLRGGRCGRVHTVLGDAFSAVGFSFELDGLIPGETLQNERINCLVLYHETTPELMSFVDTLHQQGKSTMALSYEQMLTTNREILAEKYDCLYHNENGGFREEVLICI